MSPPKKLATTLESPSQPLEGGTKKGKSNQLEHQEDKEGSVSRNTNRELNPLFSMQESLVIPKKMTLKDRLNFCAKHIPMQNLYGRLEADSILGGESLSPFWNEYTKAISDAFSARLYGLRKYKKQVQQAIQDNSEKPDSQIDPQRCVEDQGISI